MTMITADEARRRTRIVRRTETIPALDKLIAREKKLMAGNDALVSENARLKRMVRGKDDVIQALLAAMERGRLEEARVEMLRQRAHRMEEVLRKYHTILTEAGFDDDEPISGADTVELVSGIYEHLADVIDRIDEASW